MSASMNTILVIGGTSGIGEAFSRRFHAAGKKVIITGRREDKLKELESSLRGVETYKMDNTDLDALPQQLEHLTSMYPEIDTVWVNGGIQKHFKFDDPTSTSDGSIIQEINTNATAPVLIARYVIPFLLKKDKPTQFMITSSGLAFVPLAAYPVYCPTKAFIHHFLVGLRQQMRGTNVNVIEIVAPRVGTELEAEHRDVSDPGIPSMPLEEYTDRTFEILDNNDASELEEVAVGSAYSSVQAWRGSIGKILEERKMGG